MGNLRRFIRETIRQHLFESDTNENALERVNCIKMQLEREFDKYYRASNGQDGTWIDIRQQIRKIDRYLKTGHFMMQGEEEDEKMEEFLSGLDYSDSHTYKKGEKMGFIPNTSSKIPIYRAEGSDKTLFRGVSLRDWERIKSQGFIDSDMRDAIVETEGINLAQRPNTAKYYLPHNSKGVIIAISPKNLDLYILEDEYIRVFEPIPIKNVIKVSDVFMKDDMGATLTTNTEKNVRQIIDNMKELGIEINC